jgi:hypothetical protein
MTIKRKYSRFHIKKSEFSGRWAVSFIYSLDNKEYAEYFDTFQEACHFAKSWWEWKYNII